MPDTASLPRFVDPSSGFSLDARGMDLPERELRNLCGGAADAPLVKAHTEMGRIEDGEIKNPDENRRVTHFSDRETYCDSALFRDVEDFARRVRDGSLTIDGRRVAAVVVNGIGGSALGPQLLQFAVNGPHWNELENAGAPRLYFLDNTDPAGIHDLKEVLDFADALVVSISKSGGTQETRNNMVALAAEFAARGLSFPSHAVAVTMEGSKLDRQARDEGWLKIFPMAESIGGRTSETNIVGHVPAALTGVDFRRFVEGARHMDELTRAPAVDANPAYQLAAAWHIAGNGRGNRNMVVVPYADRLVLLGKYLQQLVMESLGKEHDLDGAIVHQGLTVYGNKGGTDAHAYIQQLNDGRDDFFAVFIEPLADAENIEVDDNRTMGDALHAFKAGLVRALRSKRRKVIDITIDSVDEFNLGMLIALFERAVAAYAELIRINAFHQPGVQAYKEASKEVDALFSQLTEWLAKHPDWQGTAAEVGEALGSPGQAEEIETILRRLAINHRGLAAEWGDAGWLFRRTG